jgi:hypothetical protein
MSSESHATVIAWIWIDARIPKQQKTDIFEHDHLENSECGTEVPLVAATTSR